MGIIPDVDLKPVERAANTMRPVLERLATALEEHNRIERVIHGLNTDAATGAQTNAKSEEEHQSLIRNIQAALGQAKGRKP